MYSRKNRETKQRFTIKKFKVGAASVLIGTVFLAFANAQEVKANTAGTTSTDETTELFNSGETDAISDTEETPVEPVVSPEAAAVETPELVTPEAQPEVKTYSYRVEYRDASSNVIRSEEKTSTEALVSVQAKAIVTNSANKPFTLVSRTNA